MKRILFLLIAITSLTFVSCSQSVDEVEAVDEAVVEAPVVEAVVADSVVVEAPVVVE